MGVCLSIIQQLAQTIVMAAARIMGCNMIANTGIMLQKVIYMDAAVLHIMERVTIAHT
jgi:hypothetical protein